MERTESVRKLKEDFADASTRLETLTAAVEEKKARDLPAHLSLSFTFPFQRQGAERCSCSWLQHLQGRPMMLALSPWLSRVPADTDRV